MKLKSIDKKRIFIALLCVIGLLLVYYIYIEFTHPVVSSLDNFNQNKHNLRGNNYGSKMGNFDNINITSKDSPGTTSEKRNKERQNIQYLQKGQFNNDYTDLNIDTPIARADNSRDYSNTYNRDIGKHNSNSSSRGFMSSDFSAPGPIGSSFGKQIAKVGPN